MSWLSIVIDLFDLISSYFQSRAVTAPSSSPAWAESRTRSSPRGCTSGCPGSSTPSSMTSGTRLHFFSLANTYLALYCPSCKLVSFFIVSRSRPRKITSPTGSKDLQMVNISLRVLSRPDMTMIPAMHKELGSDFDEKVGDHAFDMISEKWGFLSCR